MEGSVTEKRISDNLKRTIAHLENIMVVVWDFSNGPMKEPDPFHSHPHEQITYVAEGELVFYMNEEEHHLRKGDLITIPSGVKHCIRTLSMDVRLIDSFSPIRKDLIS
ncbi:MAG TPA: cupin domain-containing protein [Bacteroidales bacterium]|nr:cupin domain-containing protein [Bacteroidales bacterium]